MRIRQFQAGDEAQQVAIYNAAAAELPRFKPATVVEVQRRSRARDFDAGMRFFAEENGQAVAYANFNPNGRVSYPWSLQGFSHLGEPLFEHVLTVMRQRGLRRAFAAYRDDWPSVRDFFLRQGFRQAREMINYVMDLVDMPTAPARPGSPIARVQPADIAAIFEMMPEALRAATPQELEQHLLHNPYFTPESVFVLRGKTGEGPVAVGVLITEPTYADPRQVDAAMPCYRLGAFGTEGMQAKRIKGLFSFLARKDVNVAAMGLDLMSHAASRLRDDDDISALAAQAPSDAPALIGFYQRNFQRQGSFPVFERELD